jgi:autotransporter passenger strand-loop-strand repeat protein
VLAGGEIELLSGALISNVTIESSGIIEVGSGYTLDGAAVSSGDAVLSNGAIVEVAASGSTTALTISGHSQEIVFSGGTDSGSLITGNISTRGNETLSGGTAISNTASAP